MMMEQCKNPLKPGCPNKDIAVYLQITQEKLSICQQCWTILSETTEDWDKETLKD
ncbi:MAG: hypothetical protein FWF66_00590 [Candidatus Bathyarchaeota archaeon]|nr:hypothetical protein [Candidatus Termiticorpusculum sp.]